MTAAERTLLLALFRWGRAEGLEYGRSSRWSRQTGERETWWGVDFCVGDEYIDVWRGRANEKRYFVASIAEAVDVLAALGIVPPRFSTAYRAGWYVAAPGHLRSLTDEQYAAILPVGLP
jgi:hypothetical protein